MKAQRRLGLALSCPRIISAFLLDVAVLVLAAIAVGLLLAWLALYLAVSAPINRQLTAAADFG
jgi:uncharacterized RDD family membrane protein YckC